MQTREEEMTQFEAMGNFTEDRIEELARSSRRPQKPRRAHRDDARSTSELEALALPLENTCPRLA